LSDFFSYLLLIYKQLEIIRIVQIFIFCTLIIYQHV
jgi:hypothetical protein